MDIALEGLLCAMATMTVQTTVMKITVVAGIILSSFYGYFTETFCVFILNR